MSLFVIGWNGCNVLQPIWPISFLRLHINLFVWGPSHLRHCRSTVSQRCSLVSLSSNSLTFIADLWSWRIYAALNIQISFFNTCRFLQYISDREFNPNQFISAINRKWFLLVWSGWNDETWSLSTLFNTFYSNTWTLLFLQCFKNKVSSSCHFGYEMDRYVMILSFVLWFFTNLCHYQSWEFHLLKTGEIFI